MKTRRGALVVAIVLTVAVLVGLIVLAPTMHPIPRATADEFWQTIGGINISGSAHVRGWGALALHNGKFVYTVPGMDDIWLEWVPEAEVMASWPAAEAEFEKLVAAKPELSAAIGYQRWKSVTVREQAGFVGLNRAILAANSERVFRENPKRLITGDLYADQIQAAEACAEKMDWYWATFTFEFLFLGGLVWWICWPVIRGSGVIRYMVHWSLVPTLVLLPTWLGYAFPIPNIRETGGILYPWLLGLFGHPSSNAAWEVVFLSHLPPVLEPLCQHAWFDPFHDKSFGDFWTMHGPISAMIAGGVVLVIVLLGAAFNKYYFKAWLEQFRPRGFNVIHPAPTNTGTDSSNKTPNPPIS